MSGYDEQTNYGCGADGGNGMVSVPESWETVWGIQCETADTGKKRGRGYRAHLPDDGTDFRRAVWERKGSADRAGGTVWTYCQLGGTGTVGYEWKQELLSEECIRHYEEHPFITQHHSGMESYEKVQMPFAHGITVWLYNYINFLW